MAVDTLFCNQTRLVYKQTTNRVNFRKRKSPDSYDDASSNSEGSNMVLLNSNLLNSIKLKVPSAAWNHAPDLYD